MRWIIYLLLFHFQLSSCEKCYESCSNNEFNLNLCFTDNVDIKIIQDLSLNLCNTLNLNISNEVFNYSSPSPINNLAVSAPIPLVPPVINATLSLSFFILVFSL